MATRNSRLGIGVSATGTQRTRRDINDIERALRDIPEDVVAKIDADTARARVKALDIQEKLEELERMEPSPRVELETAKAQADLRLIERQLAALDRRRVRVQVDVDQGIAGLGALTNAATSAGRTLAGVFTGVGPSLGNVVGLIGGMVTSLAKASVGAVALAEAGAAITVAWGAASTAIAAVPAAVGLIAAPMAAVKLGMDGIERAAKKIEPQFKRLQAAVSAAFETGLTPVLQRLANELFPRLQVGLSATATALSGVAARTTEWLTSTPGIQLLSTTIGNINAAISQINLVPLIEGFLRLAGNKAGLDLLTTAINGVGTALESISKNEHLTKAFQGLSGVVSSLTRAFTDLVNNGIELFAAAAPGAQEAINGIGSFFNKFDWTALGQAAGGALRGLGAAVASIPQSTVDAITKAFQGLATTLQSEDFAAGMRGIASAIPPVINALNGLVTAFGAVGRAIGAVVSTGEKIYGWIDGAIQKFDEFTTGVGQKLGTLPPTVETHMGATATAGQTGSQNVANALTNPMQPVPGLMGQIMGQAPGAIMGPLAPVPGQAQQFGTQLRAGFGSGVRPIPGDLQSALQPMGPTLKTTAIDPMLANTQTGMGLLTGAFSTGFAGAAGTVTPFTQALAAANPQLVPFNANITALATALTTANPQLTTLGTTLTTLNPALTTLSTTLATLNPALTLFGQNFTALGTSLATTNPQLTTLGTTLTTLNPALTTLGTTLSTLNPTLTAFADALNVLNPALTAFGTGSTTLGTALTTLNPQLTTFTTTLTTLNPQLTTLSTTLETLNPLLVTFNTNMTTLSTTLQTLNPQLTTLAQTLPTVTTALTNLGTALTTFNEQTMAAFLQGIIDKLNQMVTEFTTKLDQVKALVETKGQEIATAQDAAMTAFWNTTRQGLSDWITLWLDYIDALIQYLESLYPVFEQIGYNFGISMAIGMQNAGPEVFRAGQYLGMQAQAGMQSVMMFGSPSKLGIEDGENFGGAIALGMDNTQRAVFASAAQLGRMADAGARSQLAGLGAKLGANVTGQVSGAIKAGVDIGHDDQAPIVVNNQLTVEIDGKPLEQKIDGRIDRKQTELRRSMGVR